VPFGPSRSGRPDEWLSRPLTSDAGLTQYLPPSEQRGPQSCAHRAARARSPHDEPSFLSRLSMSCAALRHLIYGTTHVPVPWTDFLPLFLGVRVSVIQVLKIRWTRTPHFGRFDRLFSAIPWNSSLHHSGSEASSDQDSGISSQNRTSFQCTSGNNSFVRSQCARVVSASSREIKFRRGISVHCSQIKAIVESSEQGPTDNICCPS